MGKPAPQGQPTEPFKDNKVSSLPEACACKGCKTKVTRFGFCGEHYEQFKFGLVKKDGTKAADYEKKIDHYQDFLAKEKLKKVA